MSKRTKHEIVCDLCGIARSVPQFQNIHPDIPHFNILSPKYNYNLDLCKRCTIELVTAIEEVIHPGNTHVLDRLKQDLSV